LRAQGKRRATTKRLRYRELVLSIVPTGWQLPTGEHAVYLTPMIDATTIGSLEAQLQATLFYLAEGERLAHTGSWAFDDAGFKHWSSELFALNGLTPAGKAPSAPAYTAPIHPADTRPRAATHRRTGTQTRAPVRQSHSAHVPRQHAR